MWVFVNTGIHSTKYLLYVVPGRGYADLKDCGSETKFEAQIGFIWPNFGSPRGNNCQV